MSEQIYRQPYPQQARRPLLGLGALNLALALAAQRRRALERRSGLAVQASLVSPAAMAEAVVQDRAGQARVRLATPEQPEERLTAVLAASEQRQQPERSRAAAALESRARQAARVRLARSPTRSI